MSYHHHFMLNLEHGAEYPWELASRISEIVSGAVYAETYESPDIEVEQGVCDTFFSVNFELDEALSTETLEYIASTSVDNFNDEAAKRVETDYGFECYDYDLADKFDAIANVADDLRDEINGASSWFDRIEVFTGIDLDTVMNAIDRLADLDSADKTVCAHIEDYDDVEVEAAEE